MRNHHRLLAGLVGVLAIGGMSRPAWAKKPTVRQRVAALEAQLAALTAEVAAQRQGEPPVVHALTAVTATSATTAEDATNLGGRPASDYVRATGTVVMGISPQNALSDDPNVNLANVDDGVLRVTTTNTSTDRVIIVPLDLPTSLFGRTLALASVEVCSAADGENNAPQVTAVAIREHTAAGTAQVVLDDTNRPEGGCFSVSPPSPHALDGPALLVLTLSFASTGTELDVTRIKVSLAP